MDTIVAISTPIGRGGIGIVRLSGEPLDIAFKIFKSAGIQNKDIMPQFMYFGTIMTEGFYDKGYMVYFKAPKSFTGEDIIEFHCHGGIRILQGIVAECIKNGARPAEAGEFTKRAFMNGKMALADAEGVIDMINADSEEAVNAAYRLMSGHLTDEIRMIQAKLTDIITDLEAVLDYPEELENEILPKSCESLQDILNSLEKPVKYKTYGKMAKFGIDVAIVGETNVGKSSLMNALLGDNRAIVSDIRGTTRDIIRESLEYKGIKINLIDTAGIRVSGDVIEQEGVKRAKDAALSADLVIMLNDITQKENVESKQIEQNLQGKRVIKVYNKSDLIVGEKTGKKLENGETVFIISAKTKDGITELLNEIAGIYLNGKISGGEIMTNERHLFAVQRAYNSVAEAINNYENVSTDCILLDLKEAWQALGEITGDTVTEDIIDNIFNKFCVGK